jgi:ankyrin repeat protein
MPLSDLSNELIFTIVDHLDDAGANTLARTHSQLYKLLNEHLYLRDVIKPHSRSLAWAVDICVEAATSKNIVQLAIDAGRYLKPKPENLHVALGSAAAQGYAHLVEKLLEIDGIDPNFGGHSQKPPLALAAKNGHSAVVELLLAAVNIDADIITDQNDITPLCYAACAQPYYPAVGRNIQTSCTRFNLAYASRCQDGHISIVKQLLAQEDVDPNFQSSKDGSTALMLASKHPDIIKLLLDHKGIDVNRQDHLNVVPLF